MKYETLELLLQLQKKLDTVSYFLQPFLSFTREDSSVLQTKKKKIVVNSRTLIISSSSFWDNMYLTPIWYLHFLKMTEAEAFDFYLFWNVLFRRDWGVWNLVARNVGGQLENKLYTCNFRHYHDDKLTTFLTKIPVIPTSFFLQQELEMCNF